MGHGQHPNLKMDTGMEAECRAGFVPDREWYSSKMDEFFFNSLAPGRFE